MRSKTQKKAHTHTDAPAKQSIERCSPDFHCGLKMLPSPNPMHDDQAPRELTALQLRPARQPLRAQTLHNHVLPHLRLVEDQPARPRVHVALVHAHPRAALHGRITLVDGRDRDVIERRVSVEAVICHHAQSRHGRAMISAHAGVDHRRGQRKRSTQA